MLNRARFLLTIIVLASLWLPLACSDGGGDQDKFPTPIASGDDGRLLLWKPAPGGKGCAYPDYSPDGKKLACSYGSSALIILDVETLEITELVPEEYGVQRPDWSPNYDWIAFQADFGARDRIWLCRPDGSDLHLISGDRCYLPFWNADGTRVYYVGEPEVRGDLAIMYYDLNTKKNVIVKRGEYRGWEYRAAIPSRDGLWLAASMFINPEPWRNIKLALGPAAGDIFKIILGEEDFNNGWAVDWSPDNSHVLFTYEYYNGVAPIGLWTCEFKTGVIRQLTIKPPDVQIQTVIDGSWGPNGEIAFSPSSDDLGRHGWIYLIDAPK